MHAEWRQRSENVFIYERNLEALLRDGYQDGPALRREGRARSRIYEGVQVKKKKKKQKKKKKKKKNGGKKSITSFRLRKSWIMPAISEELMHYEECLGSSEWRSVGGGLSPSLPSCRVHIPADFPVLLSRVAESRDAPPGDGGQLGADLNTGARPVGQRVARDVFRLPFTDARCTGSEGVWMGRVPCLYIHSGGKRQ